MSLTSLLVHDVIVTTPTIVDDNGDQTTTWDDATSTRERWWVEQRTTTEILENRAAVVGDWFGFAAPNSVVTPRARVTWGDLVFEVDGDPWPAWTPRGEHHIEVRLRRVAG